MATITAEACTLKIKNIYDASTESVKNLPLTKLYRPEDKYLNNTGLSAYGDPHVNEDPNNAYKALVEGDAPGTVDWKGNKFSTQHVAVLRLYRNNSFITVAPGNEVDLTTNSGEETLYYMNQATEWLTVEVAGEDPEITITASPTSVTGAAADEGDITITVTGGETNTFTLDTTSLDSSVTVTSSGSTVHYVIGEATAAGSLGTLVVTADEDSSKSVTIGFTCED